PGDCVLQPPTIRHRVCEASDGMEVVEIGCPAIHETWADPDTELPTGRSLPDRGYGEIGHRFVFHVAEESAWTPWTQAGWECRDTGITAATDGMADVHTVRPRDTDSRADMTHDGEFSFVFVRDGEVTLERDGADPTVLRSGDSINIPPGMRVALSSPTADLTLLHVGLP
ncbi:MAG: cupin domain-containing protein, partial [Ilumatobacteraceae bacterium]